MASETLRWLKARIPVQMPNASTTHTHTGIWLTISRETHSWENLLSAMGRGEPNSGRASTAQMLKVTFLVTVTFSIGQRGP